MTKVTFDGGIRKPWEERLSDWITGAVATNLICIGSGTRESGGKQGITSSNPISILKKRTNEEKKTKKKNFQPIIHKNCSSGSS